MAARPGVGPMGREQGDICMNRLPDMTVSQLTEVLGEQVAVFETLLDLSRRKRDVLIQGGIPEFEAILEAEQALLWQAGKLEQRRLSLQEQAAGLLGVDTEDLTMSMLIAETDGPHEEELRRLQVHLGGLLADLDGLNQGNARLLQQSLDYINVAIAAIGGAEGGPGIYRTDGRLTAPGAVQRLFSQHI